MIEAPTYSGDMGSPANGTVAVLEQRVHRLEDAVAALQDTRQLEERLVERVVDRISRNPPLSRREGGSLLIEARRTLLPTAIEMVRPASATTVEAAPVAVPEGHSWLLIDLFTEARAIFRMFVDPRYRMNRGVWLLSVGLLVALGLSWFWPGFGLPVIGSVLGKIVDLLLTFILYKVLTREARRYRALLAGAPRNPPP